MSYKNPRLLIEKLNQEVKSLRERLMLASAATTVDRIIDRLCEGQDQLNDVSKLINELGTMAMRPSIDDVTKLSPGEYVATMKPLVANYHRALMGADKLAPCLLEDLQAFGCILILLGDEKSVVRTAHDPAHPTIALVMESMLEAMDSGTKQAGRVRRHSRKSPESRSRTSPSLRRRA